MDGERIHFASKETIIQKAGAPPCISKSTLDMVRKRFYFVSKFSYWVEYSPLQRQINIYPFNNILEHISA